MLRALIFVIVSTTTHFLAARWLLAVSPWARARRRRVFVIAGALSLAIAFLRIIAWRVPSQLMHDLVPVVMVEMAIVLISLLPLGAISLAARLIARAFDAIKPPPSDDVRAERISRREAIERVAGLSVASTTTVLLGWGMTRGRHALQIDEVPIVVPGWPRALDGYVIAQISDIHVGTFIGEQELDHGLELIQRIRPDLVVATGDLVDDSAEVIDPLLARLVRAQARDGAYAILGNHDHYAGAPLVAAAIRRSPVRLLDNEGVRIRPGDGGGFALLGVDDMQGRRRFSKSFWGPDLDRALASVPGLTPDIPRILLAHQPRYFYESQGRIALQLSGHTHGGQINPGFRPARALMEFIAGRYDRAGSTLYVNRGFGTTGPPARIAAPPEITKLVIVAG